MEAIYAVDSNNGLSKDGIIPWRSKKDLKFFMNITKNNVVIMGRNTYFSLPKRPLNDRLNIILTSKPVEFSFEESKNFSNVIFTNNDKIYISILNCREKYIKQFPSLSRDFKIFIIGGKKIYEQFMPLCERVWVTRIKKDYSCDLFFDYNYSKQFKEEVVDEDEELVIKKYEKSILPSGSTLYLFN
jgi:dihydrofolate reductase